MVSSTKEARARAMGLAATVRALQGKNQTGVFKPQEFRGIARVEVERSRGSSRGCLRCGAMLGCSG